MSLLTNRRLDSLYIVDVVNRRVYKDSPTVTYNVHVGPIQNAKLLVVAYTFLYKSLSK